MHNLYLLTRHLKLLIIFGERAFTGGGREVFTFILYVSIVFAFSYHVQIFKGMHGVFSKTCLIPCWFPSLPSTFLSQILLSITM